MLAGATECYVTRVAPRPRLLLVLRILGQNEVNASKEGASFYGNVQATTMAVDLAT